VSLEPLGESGQILVVAAPLDEVDETLHQLLVVELVVAGAVLLATLLLGLWLVRVGLRPLGRIEVTAAAIAGGDLSQRVENDDPKTEVGRLGGALNTMLGQIEEAFDERTASEQRLRRFVADASHELRTPLAAVRAYAELFDRGARERPDDLERAMTGIQRESRRMGLLVDDLLLLARLDQGRPLERKAVDLVGVASDAVEAARMLDPDRLIDLVAPAAVEVEGDRERLRQILDNLLANVRAHTPAGTPATVRVVREDDRAVIEVVDAGPGLSDEQLQHAFERFYRGDESRSRDVGGAGLGLAIAAAIAESHGGSATVANLGRDGGPGLTVRVSLPTVV
jgi:two-component system OmpR family sensor kinase